MPRVDEDASEDEEVALPGGNMSTVVRRGQTVRRTAGPWTPTIHRLLDHLRTHGVTWLPRPLGLDERGREVLTYLPGTVPNYPLPPWVWTERVLVDATARLAELHRASTSFDVAGAVWQLPAHEPVEVICLNDVAPYNMVFGPDHQLVAMIDIDTASPGPRARDLAYLAYRLVPLTQAEDTGVGPLSMAARRHRLALICGAYAAAGDQITVAAPDVLRTAVDRLDDLAAFTAARAAAGAEQVADHVQIYRDDAGWIRRHLDDLQPG